MSQAANQMNYGYIKQDNNIEMYSMHNEGKSVNAERFTGTLYKYMASIYRNVYIDILADIINKYSNTYSTINVC